MITLKKEQDKIHEITNDRGTMNLASSSDTNADAFSPGDYLNGAVAICMGLNLDALIERDQLDVRGYSIEISSTRAENARPRRLEKLDVKVTFDADLDEKTKNRLVKSA